MSAIAEMSAFWGDLPTWLGLLGAVAAFVCGLEQYQRSQEWKKAEFLAAEMKEFLANPRVTAALTMVDWGMRSIEFPTGSKTGDAKRITVTRHMQVLALRPHTLVKVEVAAESESEGSAPGERTGFTLGEAAIRDCYDALLDGFERFGGYVESGLVTAADLRPYIGYWIADIHSATSDPEDAAWSAALITYIHFYSYRSVSFLFDRCGTPIGLDSEAYLGFLAQMQDQTLARQLHESACNEVGKAPVS